MKETLYDDLHKYLQKPLPSKRALVGLDGFVDELIAVVDQRIDAENYTRIQTITDYGKRILDGGGSSLNLESIILGQKLGGNGPIYARGLQRFGMSLCYIGAVGRDEIHPVFKELMEETADRIVGIADPAHTRALEFSDGKIIDSVLHELNSLTWGSILE